MWLWPTAIWKVARVPEQKGASGCSRVWQLGRVGAWHEHKKVFKKLYNFFKTKNGKLGVLEFHNDFVSDNKSEKDVINCPFQSFKGLTLDLVTGFFQNLVGPKSPCAQRCGPLTTAGCPGCGGQGDDQGAGHHGCKKPTPGSQYAARRVRPVYGRRVGAGPAGGGGARRSRGYKSGRRSGRSRSGAGSGAAAASGKAWRPGGERSRTASPTAAGTGGSESPGIAVPTCAGSRVRDISPDPRAEPPKALRFPAAWRQSPASRPRVARRNSPETRADAGFLCLQKGELGALFQNPRFRGSGSPVPREYFHGT